MMGILEMMDRFSEDTVTTTNSSNDYKNDLIYSNVSNITTNKCTCIANNISDRFSNVNNNGIKIN